MLRVCEEHRESKTIASLHHVVADKVADQAFEVFFIPELDQADMSFF